MTAARCGLATQHNIRLHLAELGSDLACADVLKKLQRTEPIEKVLVLLPSWNRWDRRRLTDLLKRLPFHLEICPRVDLSCFDVHVTQEVADHVERDSALQ